MTLLEELYLEDKLTCWEEAEVWNCYCTSGGNPDDKVYYNDASYINSLGDAWHVAELVAEGNYKTYHRWATLTDGKLESSDRISDLTDMMKAIRHVEKEPFLYCFNFLNAYR